MYIPGVVVGDVEIVRAELTDPPGVGVTDAGLIEALGGVAPDGPPETVTPPTPKAR